LLLQNSFEQYKANFKTAVVFALLLVFVPVFGFFSNIFISSGSIFLDYSVLPMEPLLLLVEAVLAALFLVFYSFFVSIIIFSVRKSLSKLKLQFYFHEMFQKFTLRIFAFYAIYSIVLFLIAVAIVTAGFSILIATIILLVLSVIFMFVPQAVVIEEEGLKHAVSTNFEFLFKNPTAFLKVLVVGAIMLAVLQLLEFALSQFTLLAPYASLFLSLVFVLPFLEILKTYLYMMRFDIIKSHEIASRAKPKEARPEPESIAAAPKL